MSDEQFDKWKSFRPERKPAPKKTTLQKLKYWFKRVSWFAKRKRRKP
jgi:hypothetical protein